MHETEGVASVMSFQQVCLPGTVRYEIKAVKGSVLQTSLCCARGVGVSHDRRCKSGTKGQQVLDTSVMSLQAE